MDDRIMKYLNIGLGVAIAIVAIVAGVMFYRSKAQEADTIAQQEAVSEELTEAGTENAGTEASYIDIPGWTDREDVKGDKEGISLDEASASASTSSSSSSSSSSSNTSTTKTTTSTSTTAATTTNSAAAASTTSSATAASTTTDTATAASTTTDASTTASTTTDSSATATTTITTITEEEYQKMQEAAASQWVYDENYHWHNKDGAVTDKAVHSYTMGVCSVCGYKLTWKYDTTYHWHLVNGVVYDKTEHSLSGGVCSVCGYKASQSATGTESWNYDSEHHWHVVNGNTVDRVNHVYDNSGTCKVCGYTNPSYDPDAEEDDD